MSLGPFKKIKARNQRRQRKAHLSLLEGRSSPLEALEQRRVPAAVVSFNPVTDVLTIQGNDQPDVIAVSCDVDTGVVFIGTVPLSSFGFLDDNPDVPGPGSLVFNNSQISAIRISSAGGNDQITTENYDCPQDIDIFGGSGNDTIVGGLNDEYIDGGSSFDLICAGYGNDVVHGDSPPTDFDPGDDPDDLALGRSGGNGNDTIDGGPGNDVLYGWEGADYLYGGTGRDRLFGGRGNDRLCGAEGSDVLYGGLENDLLNGGTGDDVLYGDTGNTQVDLFYGGSDVADHGGGNDLFFDESFNLNIYNPGFSDSFQTIGTITAFGHKNTPRNIRVACPEIVCPVIVVDLSENDNDGGGDDNGPEVF